MSRLRKAKIGSALRHNPWFTSASALNHCKHELPRSHVRSKARFKRKCLSRLDYTCYQNSQKTTERFCSTSPENKNVNYSQQPDTIKNRALLAWIRLPRALQNLLQRHLPIEYRVFFYVRLVVLLVGLQVGVFGTVAQHNDSNGEVNKRLTRCLLVTDVLVQVLANKTSWLLSSWSLASWQLLVEGDKLGHSLGVWVGANVL